MEIVLLTVGKTSIRFVKEGVEEYENRLRRYVAYRSEALPDVKNARNLSEAQQKEAEGLMILQSLKSSDFVILLDERGREFTSMEFSAEIQKHMLSGLKRLVYVVGGPYGFSEKVYTRANAKVSFSRMTFNHEMIRLFFTEQVYRAFTIMRNEPYHHE